LGGLDRLSGRDVGFPSVELLSLEAHDIFNLLWVVYEAFYFSLYRVPAVVCLKLDLIDGQIIGGVVVLR
jgi:hypothetical protein